MRTTEDVRARPSEQIPIDDPQAALRFCRSLAQALEENSRHEASLVPKEPGESRSPTTRPVLSVVLPVYDEEENILTLHRRLTAVLDGEYESYELVFVDDGSTDSSSPLLRELASSDPHLTVVELARNFGHQVAISAGLDFARGDAVIVMDADLQDPPEVLPQFIKAWRDGNDVVYAIRERRQEGWLMRGCYTAFYRLLRRMTSVEIPLDAGDFCIMDRRVVDLLRSMPERNRFVRGIRSWVGLRQTGLPYERHARRAGRPKYTLGRLMLLAVDGFVSFSHVPLRVATVMGLAISVVSLGLAAFYFVKRLVAGLTPPGFATLVVAVFFLAGVQLITIGVVGEYVGRVFDEVKQRPLYVVSAVSRGSLDAHPDA